MELKTSIQDPVTLMTIVIYEQTLPDSLTSREITREFMELQKEWP